MVVDGPDLGPRGRWAGDVVEALKMFVVGAISGREDESAGNVIELFEMFPPREHTIPPSF